MSTRSAFTLAAIVAALTVAGCKDAVTTPITGPSDLQPLLSASSEPLLSDDNTPPADYAPSDVLAEFSPAPALRSFALASTASLTPGSFSARLRPGESAAEHKVIELPAAPPKGDVLFLLDLTGSMGGVLNNAKLNSIAIMNAVAGVIPDVAFGAASHEDYPGTFSTSIAAGQACNYNTAYGVSTDRPWRLNRSITTAGSTVAAAINGMVLGSGADGPESYSRAFYETYSDPNVMWRPGAARIVVAWNDNIPHDCDYNAIIGGTLDSGHDPGRDNVVGTADDLHILDVLDGMRANNIQLINLNPFLTPLWDAYAARAGGKNFRVNTNGTFPSGTDIPTAIADLIRAQVSTVRSLKLAPCSGFEAFAPWLSSGEHTDVALPATKEFDLTITVPPDWSTEGPQTFDVCATGDGAEFGRQTVTIDVVINDPPIASAGLDRRVECSGHHGTSVQLDGSASADGDGSIARYQWFLADGTPLAEGPTPTVMLGLGSHVLRLVVTDDDGAVSAPDEVTVEVVDTTAPSVSLGVSPDNLWSPDHTYVPVTVTLAVTDACDGAPSGAGTIVSNELDDDQTGDGRTTGDIRVTKADGTVLLSSNASPVVAFGPGDRVEVRAERKGDSTSRVYTFTYRAVDASGNATVRTATVTVPHDVR